MGCIVIDGDIQNAGGSLHDLAQFIGLVILKPRDQPKAVAQWSGDHARACGGANQREARQREANR